MLPSEFRKLQKLSVPPSEGKDAWLRQAAEALAFLKQNALADDIVVYASMPHGYIQTVLVPVDAVTPADHDDLLRAHITTDDTWCIQHSWGPEGHEVYLEPPLHHPGCVSLDGAEPIVFRRDFQGMRGFDEPIEPAQKLIHCFRAHYMDERKSYCRLDERGDLEDVIRIVQVETPGSDHRQTAVLIAAKDLAEYMAVSSQVLFRKFDFTRFDTNFGGWGDCERDEGQAPDLAYHAGVMGGASFINGFQIMRPTLTVADMIAERERANDPAQRQYETFKIQDWKNNRLAEVSCGPDGIANYFTESDKPFEISPVFFRPEVLQKYKADPDKYEIRERTITCRNAWHLKTYDINEHGQVHTYIGYLANLPYEEQQYWKLFNEWPKGPISKRAFENDIEGKWTSDREPLFELKRTVLELDKRAPRWWKPRGAALSDKVLYPATTSSKEWGDEVLALDQLVVEGFVAKELRVLIQRLGGTIDPAWQSLKLVEAALVAAGTPADEAADRVAPLRQLHHLRSKVKSHAAESEKRALEKGAIAKHGSLRAHFRSLVDDCAQALDKIVPTLRAASEP